MPASSKHLAQQLGVGMADGTALEDTGAHETLPEGYATALEDTGAHDTLPEGYATALEETAAHEEEAYAMALEETPSA
jgi:hypothetical protein